MKCFSKSVWIFAAATGGPGSHLRFARREVGDQAAHLPHRPRDSTEPRLVDPVARAHLSLLGRVELGELSLEPRRQNQRRGTLGVGELFDLRGRLAPTGKQLFSDVGDVDRGFQGDGKDAEQHRALVRLECQGSELLAGVEVLFRRSQNLGLGLGVLLARARLLRNDIQTLFHRREVGEHEVKGELFELRRRLRVGTEAPSDFEQHVGLPRESDALGAAAGRRVLDAHLGGRGLGRLDRLRQPGQAAVGDVDHADPVRAASRGQGVEQRRLAGPRRADDGDVYRQLDFPPVPAVASLNRPANPPSPALAGMGGWHLWPHLLGEVPVQLERVVQDPHALADLVA